MYADTHGVLRRTRDGGKTWKRIGGALPPGVAAPLDQQFAVDSAGVLYYASGRRRGAGQIYRSTNRGASWQPAGAGLAAVTELAARMPELAGDVDGRAGTVYMAAGERGVYATRDGGRRWTRILAVRTSNIRVGAGAVFVIAGPESAPPTLYRRRSGAWTPVSHPRLDDFAVDPTSSSRLYGWSYVEDDFANRTCGRLYASSDGGAHWTLVGGALPLARENCGSG